MAVVTDSREPLAAPAAASQTAVAAVALALVASALLFAYRDALIAMVRLWDSSPMYSYGYTVPFVSGYLLWARRTELRKLRPQPAWVVGTGVLGLGLVMTVAARAAGIQVLDQLAFLVSLTGAVLLVFGLDYVKTAWAALAYLLLMVPLWDAFTERLHEPFQHRSAAIGVWLLHAIGVPAFREGTHIALPNLQVEVARVCSGVNYLVAVVALGLPLAYVFLRDLWRRVLLLVVAVAVAALSNGLRVALICTLAYYEIGSPLHGPFHVLHGLFVAGVGYLVLFAGLRLLAQPPERSASAMSTSTTAADVSVPARQAWSTVSLRGAFILIVIFVATGANVVARPSQPLALNGSLEAMPTLLGAWTADPGSAVRDTATASLWPGGDAALSRRYRRADGTVVDVFVAYFASQRQGHELITHRSTELHNRAVARRVNAAGGAFDANYTGADKHGVERLFWYDLQGGPATNRYAVKGRTVWNIVRGARSNGLVVALSTRPAKGRASDQALVELAGPIQDALAARLADVAPSGARPDRGQ